MLKLQGNVFWIIMEIYFFLVVLVIGYDLFVFQVKFLVLCNFYGFYDYNFELLVN